jgi:hypothetical protein
MLSLHFPFQIKFATPFVTRKKLFLLACWEPVIKREGSGSGPGPVIQVTDQGSSIKMSLEHWCKLQRPTINQRIFPSTRIQTMYIPQWIFPETQVCCISACMVLPTLCTWICRIYQSTLLRGIWPRPRSYFFISPCQKMGLLWHTLSLQYTEGGKPVKALYIEQYSGHPTFRGGPLSPGLPLSRGGGGGGRGACSQGVPIFLFFSSQFRAWISKQSMWARNRRGIGLSYRLVRLHRLAELIVGT